jgi:hypothetical protein
MAGTVVPAYPDFCRFRVTKMAMALRLRRGTDGSDSPFRPRLVGQAVAMPQTGDGLLLGSFDLGGNRPDRNTFSHHLAFRSRLSFRGSV